MANAQVSCPKDSSPLEFGGYSDKYKCVSFVPKGKIPKCGRLLHECLEQFCTTEFSGGHLMNWDPNDLADIPKADVVYDKFMERYRILNAKILLNRARFDERRRGQRHSWTTFDCMNFQTFCGLGCPSVEHCSWYTTDLKWTFGRWHNYYFISDFLGDLTAKEDQRHLTWVKLPACRNLVLYRNPAASPKIQGLYECKKEEFDYFACQHKKYKACKMEEKKECHYSEKHNECRLWKYTIIDPPSKYGLPCKKQKEEKCECPCSGTPEEWTQWSATCGVMIRSRMKPKNPERVDCKQHPGACCTEEDVVDGEDCKNYVAGTNINLRISNCVNGTKGVDANDHLKCVCDPGFTGTLCDTGRDYVKLVSWYLSSPFH
ncbi:hEGF domain containing protein [Trichuris trichiura]|uniref:HEGF domain containing protein n=1 Tax=Trichuris trichiura TaxID=36087 RepID=A0A077Z2N4_TRITR|nr:hEGF domain containing protein [Trichuris trichiura]